MPIRKVIYCDIDNTINNQIERVFRNSVNGVCNHDIAYSYAEAMKDTPIPYAVEMNHRLYDKADFYFFTARDYSCDFKGTKEWLDKYNFRYKDIYFVRSLAAKYDFIKANRTMKPDIVIDDFTTGQERGKGNLTMHNAVKEKIESLGIKCYVANGDNLKEITEAILKEI